VTPENFRRKHPAAPRDAEATNPDRGRQRGGEHGGEPAGEPKSPPAEKAAPPEPGAAQDANLRAETEKSLDELTSLQNELEKAKDHALRCRAEMENFKKRLSRQVEEERQYTVMPIMRDLLPVLDNMDRAIGAAGGSENAAALLAGFRMVAEQLRAVLKKYDCLEIEAMGQPFDPNRHEAVSQMPAGDLPVHTVVTVVEPGYQLHDRVVRPSKVIVSTKPAD